MATLLTKISELIPEIQNSNFLFILWQEATCDITEVSILVSAHGGIKS